MAVIPIKILQRLNDSLKKFQPIVKNAKTKDINESDTVVIVTDVLYELFGFDKYTEITSEYAIKKTYCDLAIKIDNDIRFLIEVKAVGIDLRADHIKQAVDYGSNAGVDWVILTNSVQWKIYKIIFAKPVAHDLVYEFNLLELSSKKQNDLDLMFMVSKESISKSILEDYHTKKQIVNKFTIGNLMYSDHVIDTIKRTIKKMNPELKLENESIYEIIINEVLKREIMEGDKAEEAKKRINKYFKSQVSIKQNIDKSQD